MSYRWITWHWWLYDISSTIDRSDLPSNAAAIWDCRCGQEVFFQSRKELSESRGVPELANLWAGRERFSGFRRHRAGTLIGHSPIFWTAGCNSSQSWRSGWWWLRCVKLRIKTANVWLLFLANSTTHVENPVRRRKVEFRLLIHFVLTRTFSAMFFSSVWNIEFRVLASYTLMQLRNSTFLVGQ